MTTLLVLGALGLAALSIFLGVDGSNIDSQGHHLLLQRLSADAPRQAYWRHCFQWAEQYGPGRLDDVIAACPWNPQNA